MTTGGGARKESKKLAEKAADKFISRTIIIAIGILGVVCLLLAGIIVETEVSGIALNDPELYISLFLGFAGIALLIMCGIFYALKINLKGNILLTLIEGYNNIGIALMHKVKEGTINAADVSVLSKKHYNTLEKLVLPEK
jgi:hypothetical protein